MTFFVDFRELKELQQLIGLIRQPPANQQVADWFWIILIEIVIDFDWLLYMYFLQKKQQLIQLNSLI